MTGFIHIIDDSEYKKAKSYFNNKKIDFNKNDNMTEEDKIATKKLYESVGCGKSMIYRIKNI